MLILLTITLTFLIIAVSMHNMYGFKMLETYDVPNRGTVTVDAKFDVGAFTMCSDFDLGNANGQVGGVHDCSPFNTDCSVTFDFVTASGQKFSNNFVLPDFSCPTFNAFRAFFIISIIFTAFAITTGLLYMRNLAGARAPMYFYATLTCLIISLISLMISWAIVAEAINQLENSFQHSMQKGAAFGLAVTAWVTEFLALFGLLYYHYADPTRKSVST